MVIVAVHVTVGSRQRESYLAGCASIFERRESREVLETARRNSSDNEQRPEMLSVSVAEYGMADARPLFGDGLA